MSVQIQLHHSPHKCFTNLDYVAGSVVLTLQSDQNISAINVKLEAESRTRLSAPKYPGDVRSDRKRTELEVHKLLYKIETVFPTPGVQRDPATPYSTLTAGRYEYPFNFKFPFNNDCQKELGVLNKLKELKLGQLVTQFGTETEQHVKKTLPPSLNGFPGEAEIRYYVKVTVVRAGLWNLRQVRTQAKALWIEMADEYKQIDIKFFPIEPPRPPDSAQEVFARRKQQFQRSSFTPEEPKRGLFSKKPSIPTTVDIEPPSFQIDARLPNPAILTCNEPVPLRILVQQLNKSPASVILSLFQIELIGYTTVRAHDVTRVETSSWVLLSQANMKVGLQPSNGKVANEWKVPESLWTNIPLPNTIAPGFDTCNISRRYELEVRVGLTHSMATGAKPELIVLPLRLNVQVFSGIAPPQRLLEAMRNTPAKPHNLNIAAANQPSGLSGASPTPQSPRPGYVPSSPAMPASPSWDNDQRPAAEGMNNLGHDDIPDEAPPSYEDAMAENLAPVDGPRRDYEDRAEPGRKMSAFNEKGGNLGRRVSERLFTSSTNSSTSYAPSSLRK